MTASKQQDTFLQLAQQFDQFANNLTKQLQHNPKTSSTYAAMKCKIDNYVNILLQTWNLSSHHNRIILYRLLTTLVACCGNQIDPPQISKFIQKIDQPSSLNCFNQEPEEKVEIVNLIERYRKKLRDNDTKSLIYSRINVGIIVKGTTEEWKQFILSKQFMNIEQSRKQIKAKFLNEGIFREKMQLIDSYSQCRIEIPVRGIDCDHIAIFDLQIFLDRQFQYSSRGDAQSCPICSKPAHPKMLVIDGFIFEILKTTSHREIFLDSDCSFKSCESTSKQQANDVYQQINCLNSTDSTLFENNLEGSDSKNVTNTVLVLSDSSDNECVNAHTSTDNSTANNECVGRPEISHIPTNNIMIDDRDNNYNNTLTNGSNVSFEQISTTSIPSNNMNSIANNCDLSFNNMINSNSSDINNNDLTVSNNINNSTSNNHEINTSIILSDTEDDFGDSSTDDSISSSLSSSSSNSSSNIPLFDYAKNTNLDQDKNSKNVEESSSSGEEYEVEKILDSKLLRGEEYFLLKWKGYPISESTWEAFDSLNCPDILADYLSKRDKEHQISARKKGKARNRKSSKKY